ncbi:MAG: pentapeptide repeat-containing protein, partial [Sphaerospermopsis kisseleviana]
MNIKYRFWSLILSLLLWALIPITALIGLASPALALEYNKEILIEADFSG